jgi:hypothetical protein
VTRIRRFLGAVLIAGSSTQCLLFTEPPNVTPEVILEGPDTVLKTKDAEFTARVKDDQDHLAARLRWFLREQSCPANLAEAQAEPQVATGGSHKVDARGKEGAFCVGVIATDPLGASAFKARRYDVVNQQPKAKIQMLAPNSRMLSGTAVAMATEIPLYSELRLSAVPEDDDPPARLSFRWKVTPPAGAGEPPPCATASTPDGQEFCRRLNATGEYQFEVVVLDGQLSSDPVFYPVTARPDTLPCFELTEPPHDLARAEDKLPPVVLAPSDRPYTFRVLEVSDDGDAYPTPTGVISGYFQWKWREPGQTRIDRLTDPKQTFFTIEANRYRPGDEVEVRVEYRDQQALEAYPCLKDNDHDLCQSPIPAPPGQRPCYHRVSWRLRFIP